MSNGRPRIPLPAKSSREDRNETRVREPSAAAAAGLIGTKGLPWYAGAISMAGTNPKYRLPGRIDVLLATAARYLKTEKRDDLVAVVVNARVELEEGVDYDNWDGGQTGHGLTLHLPEALSRAAL